MLSIPTIEQVRETRQKYKEGLIEKPERRPGQTEHIGKMWEILQSCWMAFDFSQPGAGKTFMTTALLVEMMLKRYITSVVIVAAATLDANWTARAKDHELPVVQYEGKYTFTPQTMTGRGTDCKTFGGLLYRRVIVEYTSSGKPRQKITFTPTQLLRQLVADGVVFVFDEARCLMGDSATHEAAKAVIHFIQSKYRKGSDSRLSRVILISGTPVDKEKQLWNAMDLMGFTRCGKVFQNNGNSITYEGFGYKNCMDSCMKFLADRYGEDSPEHQAAVKAMLDSDFSEYIPYLHDDMPPSKWNAKTCREFLMDWFVHVMIPHLTSKRMVEYETSVEPDFKNGFRAVDEETFRIVESGVGQLSQAVQDREDAVKDSMGSVVAAMVQIENSKRETYRDIIIETLEKNPNCKVACGVNFLETLHYLEEQLKDWTPQVLCGEVDTAARTRRIERFQRPDLRYRLFLFTSLTGSEGINLHDTDGRFPRFLFVSPHYRFDKLAQCSYRVFRDGVKSVPTFRLMFVKGSGERHIIHNLADKGEMQRNIVHYNEEVSTVPYPGEYVDVDM